MNYHESLFSRELSLPVVVSPSAYLGVNRTVRNIFESFVLFVFSKINISQSLSEWNRVF